MDAFVDAVLPKLNNNVTENDRITLCDHISTLGDNFFDMPQSIVTRILDTLINLQQGSVF